MLVGTLRTVLRLSHDLYAEVKKTLVFFYTAI